MVRKPEAGVSKPEEIENDVLVVSGAKAAVSGYSGLWCAGSQCAAAVQVLLHCRVENCIDLINVVEAYLVKQTS